MNEFDKNKSIETVLEETAEQIQPNLMFKAELEEKLRKKQKPRARLTFTGFQGFAPALTSLVVLGALIAFMVWLFQSVQPQAVGSEDGFVCPVTPPNGSLPPGEIVDRLCISATANCGRRSGRTAKCTWKRTIRKPTARSQ